MSVMLFFLRLEPALNVSLTALPVQCQFEPGCGDCWNRTMTKKPNSQGRRFTKMHGLRNHFVIVDGRKDSFAPSHDEIVRICDQAIGVGADELIVIEPAESGADAFMRIFNGDGREVEACGNALRCVAWLLFEESGVDDVVIETLAGQLPCRRVGDMQVRAAMGKVSMDWQSVPLSEERDTLHAGISSGALDDPVVLNVGNPHAVFFVDDTDGIDMEADALAIQQSGLFPNGVNVTAAQMLDGQKMRLLVYERGAGLTMACGSAACAAVFAARQRGLTNATEVEVELPGGIVAIEIQDDNMAVMTGPVAFSFHGNF
jgi:diaminopimelate epimerase